MTSAPQFWAEANTIASNSATLTVEQATKLAEFFLREALKVSDDLAQTYALLLTDLVPAIRKAQANVPA